jgi:hypothetical protein
MTTGEYSAADKMGQEMSPEQERRLKSEREKIYAEMECG